MHAMFGEKKREGRAGFCIYNINAPHQNYYLYVGFFFLMLFFPCCVQGMYVYMQTHVLLMSKNKDDEW